MPRRLASDGAPVEAASSAIGKAFTIIRVMRKALSPMTLTTIAEEVGIAPSSAHSILTQLLEQGTVVQDSDKRYQLGPAMFYLGSAFARATPLYRSVWMELVSAANQHSVTAAIALPWENHHLVLNAHRGGDSDVAVPFGGRVPIDAASWGKVYYQWSGSPVPAKLGKYTAQSVTSREQLLKELTQVGQLGYAEDHSEFADRVGGVCAAVTSVNGYEGLASFLAPISRIESIGFAVLGSHLATLTARASRSLGDPARMRFFGSD